MSGYGEKNTADGIFGIDSNGKAHAIDCSQILSADTFTANNAAIIANDTLQDIAQKCQGQINNLLNLAEFIPANTVYVAPNGNDTNGDGSASNPYQTISKGVMESNNGTTIKIAPSFYNETVSIDKQIALIGSEFTTILNITFVDGSQGTFIDNISIASTVSSNGFGGITFNNCNISSNNGPYATRLYSATQFADILLLSNIPTGIYIGYLDINSDIQVYDTTNLVSVNISDLMPDVAITYNTTNQFLTITQIFMATIFTDYNNNGGQSLTIDLNGDFNATGGFNFNNCQISGTQNFNCGNTNIATLNTSTLGWQTNIFIEFGKSVYLLGLTIIAPIYHAGGILFIVEGTSWAADLLTVILYSPANDTNFTDVFAINGNINAQFGNGIGTIQQTGIGFYAINVGFHGALTGNNFIGTRIPFNSASNLFANYTPTNYAMGDGYVSSALSGIDNALGFTSSQIIYVAKNGNDSTGTGSILNPYLTIGMALSVSVTGDEIKIFPGTYTEDLIILTNITIIADQNTVIIDGNITIGSATNDQIVSLQGFTYTGTCNIASLTELIMINIIEPNSGTALNIDGTVSNIILTDCFFTGDVLDTATSSGNITITGGYTSITITSNIAILSNAQSLLLLIYSGASNVLVNACQRATITHNSGLVALNGIQYCQGFISNADDSNPINTFALQNVNFKDPIGGSYAPCQQTGNCHYIIGVGCSRDITEIFPGIRFDYNFADDLFANYNPTNYAIGNGYVQNALSGIDNTLGELATEIAPAINFLAVGTSLTNVNRTVHVTITGQTFILPDATTMIINLDYNIKAINVAAVIINTFGLQTIDGVSLYSLSGYQNITYYSDGTNLFMR